MTDLKEIQENIEVFMRSLGYDADVTPVKDVMPYLVIKHRCESLDEYRKVIAHLNHMSYHSVVRYIMEEPDEI